MIQSGEWAALRQSEHMPIKIIRKKRPKRGIGEKAGLTRDVIIATALEVVETRSLALAQIGKMLGVTPAAVGAHFKGGLAEIKAAITHAILVDVASSVDPEQKPRAYFRGLFASVAEALHQRPEVALWFGSDLSDDYLVSPRLVERILTAFDAARIEPEQMANALDLVIGGLIGFVAIAFPPHAAKDTSARAAKVVGRINGLLRSHFPRTKAHKARLAGGAAVRSAAAEPFELLALAHRFSDVTVAGLDLLRRSRH
jgi:hypothetical protein